ncbi:MAG: hypothetical protein ACK2UU_05070, partial [Anaerolineae bacterium]
PWAGAVVDASPEQRDRYALAVMCGSTAHDGHEKPGQFADSRVRLGQSLSSILLSPPDRREYPLPAICWEMASDYQY